MRTESNLAKLIPMLGLAMLLMASSFSAGCGNDAEDANASPISPELSAATSDKDDSEAMGDPAELVEELAALVELTDEQKTQLTAAVEELKADMAERRAQGRPQGPPAADAPRPLQDFLVTSAEILDPAQTAAWFELLAEKHEERADDRPQRRGRGGRRGGGPRGDGQGQGPPEGVERPDPTERLSSHLEFLAAVLELDDAQVSELTTALTALAEQWQQTREGLEPRSDELREAALAHREAMKAAVQAELTEEQGVVFDALAELKPARRGPRHG